VRTLIAKTLLRVGHVLRRLSYLIGAFTALAIVVSPFIASSFSNWLTIVGMWLGIAVGAWLILFLGLPTLSARAAMAILPEEQQHIALSEQAVWAYENHHGPLPANERAELRKALAASGAVTKNRQDEGMEFGYVGPDMDPAAPRAKLRAIFPNTVLDKDREDFRAKARRVLDGPTEKDLDYLEDLELGWPRGEPNALSVFNPNNRRPELEPAEAARVDAYMQALLAVSYDKWVAAKPQP